MHDYEISLSNEQEERLTAIAIERGKTKEEILDGFIELLLSSPHSMVEGESAKAYAECSEIYLAWSEKGKD
jgi:hypothetical protein